MMTTSLPKWSTLTIPKSLGGLGIRDLNHMNQACLIKLAWGMQENHDKLWFRFLEGKYGQKTFATGSFQCKATNFESWSVGSGNEVNFWSGN